MAPEQVRSPQGGRARQHQPCYYSRPGVPAGHPGFAATSTAGADMKRYHAVKGSGNGIEHVITSQDLGKHAMWEEENHGAWVLYSEAKSEIDALHSRFAGSNPDKHSDRQSAIDAYLTGTKFHIGSRVRRYHNMTGIVTGAPRKSH